MIAVAALVLALQLLGAGDSLAHSGGASGGGLAALFLDVAVLGPLLALCWLYPRGALRLWRRAGLGRGVSVAQAAAFTAGLVVLLIALASPLEALTDESLAAHMVQHALLIAVAPPLLLAGRPEAVLSWSLPAAIRRSWPRSRIWAWLRRSFRWALRPAPAAILHGVILWAWHAPSAFQAALAHPTLHVLEHMTFLGSALLFWRSLDKAGRSRATAPAGAASAFATMLHGGFLGALMTFTPRPIYPWYGGVEGPGKLDPLVDQQLAGLIMWVPLGAVYMLAGLMLAGRVLKARRVYAETMSNPSAGTIFP